MGERRDRGAAIGGDGARLGNTASDVIDRHRRADLRIERGAGGEGVLGKSLGLLSSDRLGSSAVFAFRQAVDQALLRGDAAAREWQQESFLQRQASRGAGLV